MEPDEDWDDGAGRLATLAPLRAERLHYKKGRFIERLAKLG